MRVQGRWHQILGTHQSGILSDSVDCNAFGMETRDGLVLFDAGAGMDFEVQKLAFESAGFPDGPRHLFLTHGHADHAGGAGKLASHYDCRLYAGSVTAGWLLSASEDAVSLPAARRAGIYPSSYKYIPAEVDQVVYPGHPIVIADIQITPIPTPGHSADHMSYLVRSDSDVTLIAGDAIFAGGTVIMQDTLDCSVSDTCASIRKLAMLDFSIMLSGHGAPVVSHAMSDIATAMERVNRLLPPLNFI